MFVPPKVWEELRFNIKLLVTALSLEQNRKGYLTHEDIAKAVRYYTSVRRASVDEKIKELVERGILKEENGKFVCQLAQVLSEWQEQKPNRSENAKRILEVIEKCESEKFADLTFEIAHRTGMVRTNIYKYLERLVWSGLVKPTINGLKAETWDVEEVLKGEKRR